MAFPEEKRGITDVAEKAIETPPIPEKPKIRLLKTVAIAGASNTGKDDVVGILKSRHGLPVFDGSSSKFQRRGKSSAQDHIKRARKEHRRFDYEQGVNFDNLSEDSEQKLHQTRLGGIILAERKDKRSRLIGKTIRRNEWLAQQRKPLEAIPQEIPAISIVLFARKEVRVQRAYNHRMAEYEDQQRRILSGEKIADDEPILQKPTLDSIASDIDDRERKDVLDWAPGHRDYIREGEDPFRRTLKRPNGGPVYDFFIDTSDLTQEEVADRIEEIMLSSGAAEVINPNDHNDGSGVGIEISGVMQPNTEVNLNTESGYMGEPIPARSLPVLP